MKLRLPNKLIAAIMAAASPVLFQTLSTATLSAAAVAAVAGQQAKAAIVEDTEAGDGHYKLDGKTEIINSSTTQVGVLRIDNVDPNPLDLGNFGKTGFDLILNGSGSSFSQHADISSFTSVEMTDGAAILYGGAGDTINNLSVAEAATATIKVDHMGGTAGTPFLLAGALTLNNSSALTMMTRWTGRIQIEHLTGAGALTLKGANGNDSTDTTTYTVNSLSGFTGNLSIAKDNNTPTSATITVGENAVSMGTLSVTNGATVTVNGGTTNQSLTVSSLSVIGTDSRTSTLTLDNVALTVTGTSALSNNATFDTTAGTTTITGTMTVGGVLNVGARDGLFIGNGGVLTVAHNGGDSYVHGWVTVQNGGKLVLNQDSSGWNANANTIQRILVENGGQLLLNTGGSNDTFSGTLVLNGTLGLQTGNTSGTLDLFSGHAALEVSERQHGVVNSGVTLRLRQNDTAFTVGDGASLTINESLVKGDRGNYKIEKNGAGDMILKSATDIAGITVNGGALTLNGELTLSHNLTLASGTTTLNAGGTLNTVDGNGGSLVLAADTLVNLNGAASAESGALALGTGNLTLDQSTYLHLSYQNFANTAQGSYSFSEVDPATGHGDGYVIGTFKLATANTINLTGGAGLMRVEGAEGAQSLLLTLDGTEGGDYMVNWDVDYSAESTGNHNAYGATNIILTTPNNATTGQHSTLNLMSALQSGTTISSNGGLINIVKGMEWDGSGLTTVGNAKTTIGGEGTVKLTNQAAYTALRDKVNANKLGFDSSWAGKVQFAGSFSDINLAPLGTENSYIELNGVTGNFQNVAQNITSNVMIGSNGLTLNGGGANTITFAGSLSGTGNILRQNSSGNNHFNFVFAGDVADYTGSIIYDRANTVNLNVRFENKANTIKAALKTASSAYGQFNVTFAAENTVVNSVIDGTAGFNGQNHQELNLTVESDVTFKNTVLAHALSLNAGAQATLDGQFAIAGITLNNNAVLTLGEHAAAKDGSVSAITGAGYVNVLADTSSAESWSLDGTDGYLTAAVDLSKYQGKVTFNNEGWKLNGIAAAGATLSDAYQLNVEDTTDFHVNTTVTAGQLADHMAEKQVENTTLVGTGRFDLAPVTSAANVSLPTGVSLSDTDWHGTVHLTTNGGTSWGVTQSITDAINELAKGDSWVEFENYRGTFKASDQTLTANIRLTGENAMVITGGRNTECRFNGDLAGDGTLYHSFKGNRLRFYGNVSEYTGTFNFADGSDGNNTTYLHFGNNATTINAAITKGSAHTVQLELDNITNGAEAYTFTNTVSVNNVSAAGKNIILDTRTAEDGTVLSTGALSLTANSTIGTLTLNHGATVDFGSSGNLTHTIGTLTINEGATATAGTHSQGTAFMKGQIFVNAGGRLHLNGGDVMGWEGGSVGLMTLRGEAATTPEGAAKLAVLEIDGDNVLDKGIALQGNTRIEGTGLLETAKNQSTISVSGLNNTIDMRLGQRRTDDNFLLDVAEGGSLLVTGQVVNGKTEGQKSALKKLGAGVVTFNNDSNTFYGYTNAAGTTVFASNNTVQTNALKITGGTLEVNANGKTVTLNSNVVQTGGTFTLTAGTVTLNNSNTFTATNGVININGGGFNTGTNGITIGSGATLNLAAGGDSSHLHGSVTVQNGGQLILTGKDATGWGGTDNRVKKITVEKGGEFLLGFSDNNDTFNGTLVLNGTLGMAEGYSNSMIHLFTNSKVEVSDNEKGVVAEGTTVKLRKNDAEFAIGTGATLTVDGTIIRSDDEGGNNVLHKTGAGEMIINTGIGGAGSTGLDIGIAGIWHEAGTMTLNGDISKIGDVTMSAGTVTNINTAATIANLTLNGSATLNVKGGSSTATGTVTTSADSAVNISNEAVLTLRSSADRALNGTTSLNNGTLNLYSADSAARTLTLASVSVTGTDNTINAGGNAASFNGQVDISSLSSAAAGAELTLSQGAIVNVASVFNINGGESGAFGGTLHIKQGVDSWNNNGRHAILNIKDADVLSSAVISMEAAQTGASRVGLGIAAENVMVKGITTADTNGEKIIFSGAGTVNTTGLNSGDYNGDGNTRTLTINTAGGEYTANATVKSNLNITKEGAGTQSFTGNMSAFNGNLTVNNGTLHLGTDTAAHAHRVEVAADALLKLKSGASLSVNELVLGTAAAPASADDNGIAPAAEPAPVIVSDGELNTAITVTGTQDAHGTLSVGLGGTSIAGTDLTVSGHVDYTAIPGNVLNLNGGSLTLSTLDAGGTAQPTIVLSQALVDRINEVAYVELFTGISSLTINGTAYNPGDLLIGDHLNAGTVFAAATGGEGGGLSGSQYNIIFRADGNGTGTLLVTPEPATAALSLLALAGLAARRKRK